MVARVAKVRAAPYWTTRMEPDRSVKNSRPSGGKAKAVAAFASAGPLGGACGPMAHGSGAGGAAVGAPVVTVLGASVVVTGGAAPFSDRDDPELQPERRTARAMAAARTGT